MSTVTQRFNRFLSNIQLTKTQLEDAITKHNGVRKVLHEAYYSSAYKSLAERQLEQREYAIYKSLAINAYLKSEVQLDENYKHRTSLLVGSYGKNTAIAPPSDIDILFELPSSEFSKYDSSTYNGQSRLLQDIKKILQKTYPRTDIRADGQIVSVPFTSYKVEVLPAFRRQDGSYYYPDTHNGGSWKITNPKAEMKHVSDSNARSKGNTVRLIKMIKAWKRYCNVPIKSLVIELRAINFLSKWEYYDKSATYYDWMVRDFFSELLEYVNGNCKIPGIDEKVQYGDAWESKVKSASTKSLKACEYEAKEDHNSATVEWKKIFGDRFYYL
jgi:hypothetical protein